MLDFRGLLTLGSDEMNPRELVALRYMTHFRCTGGDCIDTCCQGWLVFVDQPHYVQLKKKLATDAASAAVFDRNVPLLPAAERAPTRHATLRMDEGETCAFLDTGRLCGLQKEHGAEILPDVCLSYPRVVNIVGARLELGGHLSCPEIARLVLFEDDATDLVPIDSSVLGVRNRQLPAASHAKGATAAMLDALRGALFELVSARRYPLRSRLFFLAAAALRTRSVFERPKIDLAALGELLGELEAPVAHAMLHEVGKPLFVPNGFALETLVRAASLRGGVERHSTFDRLMATVLESMHTLAPHAVTMEPDVEGGSPIFGIDAEKLLPLHRARNERLRERFAAHLDTAARGFLRHTLATKAPLVAAADFPGFVLALLVRAAMHELLLVFHPRCDDVVARGDEAALRDLLRDTYYVIARAFDHNKRLGDALLRAVEERVRSLQEAAAVIALV